ncbi:MAG TPA: arsinothricin resistance N-acetyltransferase ArsN1 family A [Candidatus Competibacteraceae bacterium]|nr:arsinothricin resistance N-acetyltransferase ArsN1 family A [Candidatus Competibacteraceae bacterium]
MNPSPATSADLPAVQALLAAQGLPVADLTAAHLEHFLLLRDAAGITGSVGLERRGEIGLLRSLALRPALRGQGHGAALLRALEARAGALGLTALYLLTTTAADFFGTQGYVRLARSRAPQAVRASAEFRTLCPDSAVLMVKGLLPNVPGPGRVRAAYRSDTAAIAAIYNQGIAERSATFETAPRTAADVEPWFDGAHPIVVSERDGRVLGFAATSTYRPRDCYRGVAEFSVYVDHDWRGLGVGRQVLAALLEASRLAGYWKLVSRVFPENRASLGLLEALGFRQVGRYQRHAQLDGEWRDVVIVERLLESTIG